MIVCAKRDADNVAQSRSNACRMANSITVAAILATVAIWLHSAAGWKPNGQCGALALGSSWWRMKSIPSPLIPNTANPIPTRASCCVSTNRQRARYSQTNPNKRRISDQLEGGWEWQAGVSEVVGRGSVGNGWDSYRFPSRANNSKQCSGRHQTGLFRSWSAASYPDRRPDTLTGNLALLSCSTGKRCRTSIIACREPTRKAISLLLFL